ncbi:MAG: hypothetical protein JWO90_1189, partial [Solirubrobacterales bacterium]|nr:hypothetical protein [Solirubrobacterales bacterium]
VPPGQEALIAEVLASARVLRQGAVEAVWVGSEAPKSIEVPAADAESATIRVLLVLGGPEDLDDARLAGRGVREQHAAALEAEAEELRSANARLLSSHRPVESSAAAAMVGKVGLLTQRIAEQEAELVELQRRLEAEVEVGRRNDELFQDARRVIGVREQEIAGLRATLARPRHRIAASAGSRIDRAPRPRGLLARVASKRP